MVTKSPTVIDHSIVSRKIGLFEGGTTLANAFVCTGFAKKWIEIVLDFLYCNVLMAGW